MRSIPRDSTEAFDVEIDYTILRAKVDPSPDFVGYLAFTATRLPGPGHDFNDTATWHAAAWVTGSGISALTLNVGPDGIALEPGVWHVFAGLTGTDQTPVVYSPERLEIR